MERRYAFIYATHDCPRNLLHVTVHNCEGETRDESYRRAWVQSRRLIRAHRVWLLNGCPHYDWYKHAMDEDA